MKNLFLIPVISVIISITSHCVKMNPETFDGKYYVSPFGSNHNSGSIKGPFKTITYGISKLQAGDTLFVRDGIYNERVYISGHDGNENNPVVITAYTGESPIIDGTGVSIGSGSSLVTLSSNYVHFLGIEVQNANISGAFAGGAGIYINGTNCLVSNCKVHDTWRTGIGAFGDFSRVENCEVSRYAMSNSDGIQQIDETWGAGIGLRGNHPVARLNLVHDGWGEGLSMIIADYGILEDNVIHDSFSALLYLMNSQFCTVQRNLVYMTGPMGSTGNIPVGFQHSNESYVGGHLNQNNIIINNIVAGCNRNLHCSQMPGCLIANNTFVNAKYDVSRTDNWNIRIGSGDSNGSQFINNIVVQEDTTPCIYVSSGAVGITFSNNLYNKSYDPNAIGKSDLIADPKLAKTSSGDSRYLTGEYFKLLSSSPAINKGIMTPEVSIDFFGNKRDADPDIGAFEYYSQGSI